MKTKRFLLIILTILSFALALVSLVACFAAHEHTFSKEWSYNIEYHWHPATCGHEAKSDEALHQFDADGLCKCGYNHTGVHTVTFIADGQTVDVVAFTEGQTSIVEPTVPAKEHYQASWRQYTLQNTDVIVEAVYTPIVYTVTFEGNGFSQKVTYTADSAEELIAPHVPVKEHYTGAWEEYELEFDNQQKVNAVYTAIEYTVTFEGFESSQQRTYTVENKEQLVAPEVPAKEHYTGAWEQYELEFDNEQKVNAVYTAIEYTVTFEEGVFSQKVTYTADSVEEVEAPQVPTKEHYTGVWEEYELEFDNSQTIHAKYTAIEYTVTFEGNGSSQQRTYTVENKEQLDVPEVPAKEHYTGAWEEYELEFDNEQKVNAVYTPIEYTITFEGFESSQQRTYTVENKEHLDVPEVPAKEHYTGAWEQYELEFDNEQKVNAVYTPVEYTITFEEGVFSQKVIYTVESVEEVEAPQVPTKEHYIGVWEEYELEFDNEQKVNAVYTAIEYTVTFEGFESSQQRTYTVENKEQLVAPEVPAKEHYTGVWEEYELEFDNEQKVNAVYTPIEYTITFEGFESSQQRTYTVENKEQLVAPEVPAKEHYTGAWEEYELNFDNSQNVHAKYAAIEYTVTFKIEEDEKQLTYTVETAQEFSAPETLNKTGYRCQWEEFELRYDDAQVVNGSYVAKRYTLKLDYGGAASDVESIEVNFDEAVSGLPKLDEDGKDFWGWFYNDTMMINNETKWTWDDDNAILTARFMNTQGVRYTYYGDCYHVTGCSVLLEMTKIEILDTYKGRLVTAIESKAFLHNNYITSVTIPACVTSIGNQAFEDCDYLTEVKFNGDSRLQTIGDRAFYVCGNLQSFEFEKCSGLRTIGSCAFYNSSLVQVILPLNIESIEESAFKACGSLTTLEMETHYLHSIGNEAFYERVCSTGTVFKGGVERHPAGAKIHKERPTAS